MWTNRKKLKKKKKKKPPEVDLPIVVPFPLAGDWVRPSRNNGDYQWFCYHNLWFPVIITCESIDSALEKVALVASSRHINETEAEYNNAYNVTSDVLEVYKGEGYTRVPLAKVVSNYGPENHRVFYCVVDFLFNYGPVFRTLLSKLIKDHHILEPAKKRRRCVTCKNKTQQQCAWCSKHQE